MEVSGQRDTPATLPPDKQSAVPTRVFVAGMDAVQKREISFPCWQQSCGPSKYSSYCRGSTVRGTGSICIVNIGSSGSIMSWLSHETEGDITLRQLSHTVLFCTAVSALADVHQLHKWQTTHRFSSQCKQQLSGRNDDRYTNGYESK
jgi:NADH pyrophosphatase NudC (nudix superfamily)